MSWPSSTDPFYLANTVDNNARRTYYDVNATPTMKCDGTTASWPSIQSIIQSRMAVTSHVWLDLDAEVNGNNLDVTCTAVTDVNVSGNYVIQMVLLDRYSYLPNSPNGQPNHYHAMLKFAPTASGQVFTATAFDTTYYYATFTLQTSWQIENLDMACFVQNNNTQEIAQAHCEQVPLNYPNLYFIAYTLEDDGNHDGRAEPGETASVYVTLGNEEPYQTAVNVVGTLSTDDPDLNVTVPTVDFPNIINGGFGTNSNPFQFYVDPSAEPHLTTLHLEVVADPLQTTMTVDFDVYIGWPNVLLVDDDAGGTFETYYMTVLDNLGQSYEYWDSDEQGSPFLLAAQHYPAIVWFTGHSDYGVLSTEEQNVIQGYLEDAGKLFISGQNIGQGLNISAPEFLQNVLHATLTITNTSNKILNGVAGNPVGDGMSLNLFPGGQGSGSCISPDGISVESPAEEAFLYTTGDYRGGLTYAGASGERLVFFSFPFEAISGQSETSTQEEVLQAIFNFFELTGVEKTPQNLPLSYELVSAYPNPFNPSTVIGFKLPKTAPVNLTVYDLSGSRIATLMEGPRPSGTYEVTFDGTNLASGIYIYRLKAGNFTDSGKIVLLK